ncbi:MAG: hypothetical protein J0M12_15775, partial [Deltaproteobacteria bacterium]|nr:hypothetical protein [Deltaproteobacteria bacterium]
MRATRLFTNADGKSSFEDIEIPLERSGVEQTANLSAPASMLLNETDPGHQYDWHNAPKKQWVLTLQGEIEVQLRDGTRRRFGAGSMILAEDLTGSGHATKVVSEVAWRCAYL